MDDEEAASSLFISEEKNDSLYPMYFGVSCAFVALGILSGVEMDDERLSNTQDRMLQGSAHLLGLLVWRVQRAEANGRRSQLLHELEKTEREVAELKRMRSEDAKANEKVVSIFAAQEQSWLSERKKLRQQIGALLNELRVLETKKEEVISNLNEKIQEKELLMQSRDLAMEKEERKMKELEEKLQKAEAFAEELRETAKRDAQEHSSELWKHKTALIELVSNQRQLEAEMGRSLRQVEAAKQEIDSVFEQKEESISMVQKLSMEIVKLRKDSEQKDKILSAMLRKSKLDTVEKQMLLKDVKISKARRKQSELETERWMAVCESRHGKHALRSNLAIQADSRSGVFLGARGVHTNVAGCSQNRRTAPQPIDNRVKPKTLLGEYLESEHRKEPEDFRPQRMVSAIHDSSIRYSPERNRVITTDVKQLEGWVCSETEKYATIIEQRHHLEIDAFTEQIRDKDEKLESFRWRLLGMELESKRLQSHIEELDKYLSLLRQENMKLEALLLDREAELKSLQEKITLQLQPLHCLKSNLNSSPNDPDLDHKTIWSEVKIIKRKPRGNVEIEKGEETPFENHSKDISLTVQDPEEDIEVEKEVSIDPGHVQEGSVEVVDKLASTGLSLIKKDSSSWKVNLHALGVSYKIKRLKQQLLMLERFVGTQKSSDEREANDHGQIRIKGFLLLMSVLNKQVSRYISLQEKTNDLCKRIHENDLDVSGGSSRIGRTKEETKTMAHFLEETFQLQRYMVATGQKLMEIQSRIASGFVEGAEELVGSASFDMRRFTDGVRTLFREVQRGLEVRIARIIGDLEGTLACEGIMHLRN
ncbi:hypothetical protein HHK36_029182 [Tetracentron sinense]|uniref:Uncharacterized protein n=1 Tax=Tetracentron sinense TaxID=13715 RepID=A0A834YHI0_TETSI|nr:hypothetical protein HHK36_029182 [Tetracentron sinense]